MKLSDFTGPVSADTVEVCGVPLALKEWDNRTRALWMDVSKKYGLEDMQKTIQTEVLPAMTGRQNEIETDPRIRSIDARIKKLQEKRDRLIDLYGSDDEPADIDEQIEAVDAREDALNDELLEMAEVVRGELMVQATEAEDAITRFMEAQDEARMFFVWKIIKGVERTDLDFEGFTEQANASDYEAAEEFVKAGNARWASLQLSRMQAKPKNKRTKN